MYYVGISYVVGRSTDVLSDIGGYSVDKVKFALELTPEEAVGWKSDFVNVLEHVKGPHGGKGYNVVSVKRGKVEGTYLYIFDVWGDAAGWVSLLPFHQWYPHLDRMDLKKGMHITDAGLENLYGYLQDRVKGRRKVVYQDSPVRQKRGNRDSGGHSLAIGSHTSDWRVHWTQRGEEEGYQEFQCQHDFLEQMKGAMRYRLSHPENAHGETGWVGICKAILTSAQVRLNEITGLWDWDFENILSGRMDVHGILEQKLSMIESDIDKLPRSALYALYEAITERIFNPEPEEPAQEDGDYPADYSDDNQEDDDGTGDE